MTAPAQPAPANTIQTCPNCPGYWYGFAFCPTCGGPLETREVKMVETKHALIKKVEFVGEEKNVHN